jgi:hypothetical protein
MKPCLRTVVAFSLGVRALAALAAGNAVFAPDGAWCWFSDPRAVCCDGKIYAGWMTSDGSVQVGVRGLDGSATFVATLAERFERDDHDHPALFFLPDGRLAAFYAAHARGDLHFRLTTKPGDLREWTPDRTLGFDDRSRGPRGVTYANPMLLRDEADALYVFWRGSDFKPTFALSRDLGATWTPPRTLINEKGRTVNNRPYVKYWTDGRGRIDMVFTDGHPRDEAANSVYFLRYEHGAFWRVNGTRVGGMDDLPLSPTQCDRVYDGATAGRAWIWSIAEDGAGHPVIAYTRLPKEDDHRYHYARWDGQQWLDFEIAPAGKWFPRTEPGQREPEPHYSGGMALDPANPSTVYLSRPVNGAFEIERWITPDGGRTWTHMAVTSDSPADNVRPFVVAGTPPGTTCVLWMHNADSYIHYTRYRSQIHVLVP